MSRLRCVILLALLPTAMFASTAVRAQSLEPRAYSNAPVGMNFVLGGYTYSKGDVLPDPSVPAQDVHAEIHTGLVGYSRVVDAWGDSGQVAVLLPYSRVDAAGTIEGDPRSVSRQGMGDPALRLSMNFIGAPALTAEQFAAYRQATIVGASLLVTAPWGHYESDKVINIGTNRWSFKPEVGVSHALDRWIFEAAFATTFFTANDEYLVSHTREQAPLYSTQFHVVYNFRPGIWVAIDYTYFAGGRTTVDGAQNNDLVQSNRWGLTFALPVDRQNSVKFYASTGLTARAGTDFNVVGVVWQYRWGGGL